CLRPVIPILFDQNSTGKLQASFKSSAPSPSSNAFQVGEQETLIALRELQAASQSAQLTAEQSLKEIQHLESTRSTRLDVVEARMASLDRKFEFMTRQLDALNQSIGVTNVPYPPSVPPPPEPDASAWDAWGAPAAQSWGAQPAWRAVSSQRHSRAKRARRAPSDSHIPTESRMPPRGAQIFKSAAENLPFVQGDASDA
ncbi:hypothetical protein SISNIDRAFT_456437, partial [Sistotremastrum niveocremeum HHB9708]